MKEDSKRLGTILYDGKVINLDTKSTEELKQLLEEINKKEKTIKEEINKIQDINDR